MLLPPVMLPNTVLGTGVFQRIYMELMKYFDGNIKFGNANYVKANYF